MKNMGFDIDGCMVDFMNAFRLWLNNKLNINIGLHEITSYYWYEGRDDMTKKDFWTEFDSFGIEGHGYRNLEILPGTKEMLQAVHSAGHNIFYITNRPVYAKQDTIDFFNEHKFPQRENLYFAEGNKAPLLKELNIDVFIDDSPTTVAHLAANTRAQIYCRNYKFNEHLDDNNGKWFRRVNNWAEFLEQEGI